MCKVGVEFKETNLNNNVCDEYSGTAERKSPKK